MTKNLTKVRNIFWAAQDIRPAPSAPPDSKIGDVVIVELETQERIKVELTESNGTTFTGIVKEGSADGIHCDGMVSFTESSIWLCQP